MENLFELIIENATTYYPDETNLTHMKNALGLARRLIEIEGGDEVIIIPAVILHDTGWHIFSPEDEVRARKPSVQLDNIILNHEHEAEGARIAENILSKLDYPVADKKMIVRIILGHDTRVKPISMADMIVKDADRLSRYTPECFDLFRVKLGYSKAQFLELLNANTEKWFYTDSAKLLARRYLLEKKLGIKLKTGLAGKLYALLAQLEGEVSKGVNVDIEEIILTFVREKIHGVKKMIEIYLINCPWAGLEYLQQDDRFIDIATQAVGDGGYIGIIDRQTGMIIFHPNKKIVNMPLEELRKKERPPEYLYGFWDWYNRALSGEEFSSYYQGMNIANEIVDKFQYVIPLDIGNFKWAIVCAAIYMDFFKPTEIITANILQSVREVSDEVGMLASGLEDANKQLREEMMQRKELEEKLIKTEKMAVAAQLAAEIAHEVKNPLQVINSVVYLLKRTIAENIPGLQTPLKQISDAVTRANGFINDLLNISRPFELVLGVMDVNDMIKKAMDELPKDILVNIDVILELSDGCLEISGDIDRLKQVMINLIKNAVEAMNTSLEKRLWIESKLDDGWVRVVVRDSGHGILNENIDKVFDPFHTTKPKGIGLGLAICKRFIEAHRGSIELTSEVGKGTEFVILLPSLNPQLRIAP
ncbi:HD domain-containing protein [bacterium]|nr:HD domain-containing protein [bacterium]MBU1752459.1 HD domain-containing protein [bacterium]